MRVLAAKLIFAIKVVITFVGNSAGVLLPKELLTKLRVVKGDVLHVIETENGIELTSYGFGLAKNLPLNDANKRTALIAMRLFLKLNGYDLAASPEDKYKMIIRVAASDMSEYDLAQWIRTNLEEIKSSSTFKLYTSKA